MGWTYQHAKHYNANGSINRKAELDSQFNWEAEISKYEVLKSAMKGSTYYAAVRHTNKQTTLSSVFAVICLTHSAMKDYYNFGYKDMDETAGPYEDECPKGILDLLTETQSKYALEWRERCRNNLTQSKSLASVKIGEVIEFKYGSETIRAKKMAPAYQFKTPWYQIVGEDLYIKKNRIKNWVRI